MQQSLIKLFKRDLEAIKKELQLYSDEATIWKVNKSVINSAGNLALHIIGNLNHFIGATLGNTGYIRQRNLEFSQKNIPLNEIELNLDQTKLMIEKTLSQLKNEELQNEYRRNPFEDFMTTEYFLLHLLAHLSYHLGQINYHRRLLE